MTAHFFPFRPIVLAWLLLAAGCAGRAPLPTTASEAQWQQHRARVAALVAWQARGRVGMRAGDEGWSASFDWRQQDDRFRIRLSGPFGRGVLQLAGDGNLVVLEQADGPRRAARSAEQLLEDETGWQLPVSGLRYWLLGLPQPQREERHRLDPQGRLAELEQDGWQIEFRRYQAVDGLDLPAKLALRNRTLDVKLVIQQWVPGGNS